MKKRKRMKLPKGQHNEYPPGSKTKPEEKKHNTDARREAESDIEQDAEISAHNKNDDLDEGQLARLGDHDTGLV